MPIVNIDLDTIQPNGKPGDPARTAFTKVNSNFDFVEERLEAIGGTAEGAVTQQQLQAEVTARTAGDQALQQTVDSQATAIAQRALTSDLTAEGAARVAGDNALSSRVGIMQGFKNKVINGDFRHWQRGNNYAAATGGRFTADRWYAVGTGTTIAVAIGSASSVGLLTNSRSTLQAAISSVAGAANGAYLQTKIEGVETLAGGNVTFSVKAKCASGTFRVGVELAQNFGQGGSVQVNTIGQAITLTTSWQVFTFTVALPPVTGKTIGADNSLQLTLWLDAGSNNAARSFSTGQKSGNVEFAEIQLEAGSVATNYEFLPDAVSTDLVLRYYEILAGVSLSGIFYPSNGDTRGCFVSWTKRKRSTPAISYAGSTSSFVFGQSASGVNQNLGTLTFAATPTLVRLGGVGNYSSYASYGSVVYFGDAATITITGDAELP